MLVGKNGDMKSCARQLFTPNVFCGFHAITLVQAVCWPNMTRHAPSRQPFVRVANAEANAAIAQLGERQTEDLKVPGSIPGLGILHSAISSLHAHAHTQA